MNDFFTSDQHYYHKNIIKYAKRPFDNVDEMNEHLIQQHNSVVGQNDRSWSLGDFGFASIEKLQNILRRLNGQKFLILGNHDKQIVKNMKSFIGKDYFTGIYYYKELYIDKQAIMLFHYGGRVWNKSNHGSWLLYGHSHGSLPPYGKSVDVGVDDKNISTEYRPYAFEEIKRFMDKRNKVVADHHE